MKTFVNKICPKLGEICRETKCAKFTSCMLDEIKSLNDMGMACESKDLLYDVCETIRNNDYSNFSSGVNNKCTQ